MRRSDEAQVRDLPASLTLVNDGENWNGTFLLLVQALLADLLPEGPVTATVTRYFGGVEDTETMIGLLVSCDGREIVFDDGYFIPLEQILGIGV